jgi:hypothetical protein
VIREDEDMIRRFLNVMHHMDDSYRRATPDVFRQLPTHRPGWMGGAYYYWTPTAEIVVRLQFHARRAMYQIATVGFVGSISPSEALDRMIDQTSRFVGARGQTTAFALVPKRMDNPEILKLYDLIPQHPRLKVTRMADVHDQRHWIIEFIELRPQGGP